MREKKSRKSLLSSFKTQLLAMSILPMLFSLLVVLIVAITGMRNLAQTMMYDKFECTSILVQNSSQDTIDAEMKAIAEEQDMILSFLKQGKIVYSTNLELIGSASDITETEHSLVRHTVNNIEYLSATFEMRDGSTLLVSEERNTYLNLLSPYQVKMFWTGVAMLISAIIIIFVLSTRIAKILGAVRDIVHEVGRGNLNNDYDEKLLSRKDEIGSIYRNTKSMDEMFMDVVSKMRSTINGLNDSAETIKVSVDTCLENTNGIESAVEEVAQGASQQANECTTGTGATAEINQFIDGVVIESNGLKAVSDNMFRLKDVSLESLNQLVEHNEDNTIAIKDIAKQIAETNESITNVIEIIQKIEQISSQTNLLSLNASIEAARAGEAGRGFAVVASEIGKLAEQTSALTKEITDHVAILNLNSENSLQMMSGVSESAIAQSKLITLTKDGFSELDQNINQSVSSINAIAKAMDELSTQSANLVDTLSSLSAISEENAASAEECSASVVSLNGTMEDLKQKVNVLEGNKNALIKLVEFFHV